MGLASHLRHTDMSLRLHRPGYFLLSLAILGGGLAVLFVVGWGSTGLDGTSLKEGKPMPAVIQIYTRAAAVPGGGADYSTMGYSRRIRTLSSDKLGHFRLALPPGDYAGSATATDSSASLTPTYAVVHSLGFTHVTVTINMAQLNP